MKKFNFGYRKVGKVLVACAVAVATFGVASVASADTWLANSPESIQLVPGQTTYELKLGDTLWAISQKINTTVENLAELNGIDLLAGEEKRLSVGRKIVLPGAGTSTVEKNQADEVISEGVVNKNLSTANVNVVDATSSLSVEELMKRVESVEVVDGATHVKLKDDESMDDFVKDLEEVTKETPKTIVPGLEEVPVKPLDPFVPEVPIDVTEEEPLITDKGDGVTHELPKVEIVEDKEDKLHFLKRFNEASDMILIESNGKYGLVDAGYQTQSTADYAINYLKSLGVEKLEFVLLTHYDEDHWTFLNTQRTNTTSTYENYKDSRGTEITYLGNKSLFENFAIGRVIARPADEQVYYEPKIRSEIETTLSEYNIPIEFTENFSIGDFDLSVYNNYPLSDEEIQSETGAISNHNSLAVLVEKDDYNVLLSGDIEKFDEQRLAEDLANTDNADIDLATAGHHGLSTSNTAEFVEAIDKPVAVVSYTNERLDSKGRENLENYSDVLFSGDGTVVADLTNTEEGIIVSQNETNKEIIIEKNK